jgi:chemotaxis protein CheZ
VTTRISLAAVHGADLARLAAALDADDRAAFDSALEQLCAGRNLSVTRELRTITDTLQSAMAQFREDYRLCELAERDVPDAKLRLNHVLHMTHDAAHRTIDQLEHCGAIAARTRARARDLSTALAGAREAPEALTQRLGLFLASVAEDCEGLRRHLGEALLAQGFQDLTGQILGRVITLVRDVEGILGELLRVCGYDVPPGVRAPRAEDLARGVGPRLPGPAVDEVASQDDVDALLAELDL